MSVVQSTKGSPGPLGIDPDDLASCVACGLCLAHCPTFRVSGEEKLSPRGRIAAMRAVEAGAGADEAFEEIIETCVQCRACETACPSSVPFGRMMEQTRASIAKRSVPWWQRAGYSLLGHHRLLLSLTAAAGVAQRAGLIPRRLSDRLSLPRLPIRQRRLQPTGSDVWLFTGCVMDAWQRSVHGAAVAVIGACGYGVALPDAGASCCGALHVHAGLHGDAVKLARRVMDSFPGDAPILVDSAGCGAVLKDYGKLAGTPAAVRFAGRVLDIHEWLAGHLDSLPSPVPDWRRPRVAIQDPCHLRHVQRVVQPVRTVLERFVDIVELPDEGRCCGAGGAYSALQPVLAREIRAQKVSVIESVAADVVASANPGCSMWLAGAGGVAGSGRLVVRHPVEIIAEAAGLRMED